jgi:hypothetical protein
MDIEDATIVNINEVLLRRHMIAVPLDDLTESQLKKLAERFRKQGEADSLHAEELRRYGASRHA